MIIDASALIAVILKEPGWQGYEAAMLESPDNRISPVNRMEVFMRLYALDGDWLVQKFETLSRTINLKTETIEEEQLAHAQAAFRLYGKGRHKASLNMGDCFAYALAKAKGQTILFKGGDFAKTDLESAL